MVDRISGYGGHVPPGSAGSLPNVNLGYNQFINSLLKNNGASGMTLPADCTDFSYNRQDEGGLRGAWKSLWNKTPGWIKWPLTAMAGLTGYRFIAPLPAWGKAAVASAAAITGWQLSKSGATHSHQPDGGDTFGI
ncbi:MAG TPA: hypothetical protein V6C52_06680 [Coleofasciculaceae cyanobacterium]|jgi:hypothetical protein